MNSPPDSAAGETQIAIKEEGGGVKDRVTLLILRHVRAEKRRAQ
ncbi:MAG TPA: hypothetical protein VML19_10035 [Verrucomicrobiae bacterium]|nr:hypothetical protein [Verrucomicrobiae bacterium]